MHLSAQHATSAVWAALTASAAASPLYAGTSSYDPAGDVLKRQLDIDDVDKWCGLTKDLNSEKNAEEALSRTSMAASLGMFIRLVQDDETEGWLEGLQNYVYHNDIDEEKTAEKAEDCANIGMSCKPGKDKSCTDAWEDGEEGSDWHREAWWIFKAVKGVNAKMSLLKDKLTSETVKTGLNIPQMAEDFETSMNDDLFQDDDMLDWMQVALGIGSNIMAFKKNLNPMFGAATGVVGTVLSFTGDHSTEEEEKKVSLAEVQSKLADMFDESEKGVRRTLRAAMGRAWSSQKDDYENLPSMSEDAYHDEAIANFYDSPFWLLDNSAEPVDKILEAAVAGIRVHVADMIIHGLGYGIIWDTRIEDESDCDGNGRIWMNVGGKDRCFSMFMEKDTGPSMIPKDSSIPETMEKWGIDDLEVYFQSSIDCARSKCDRPQPIGVGLVANDGLPLCYFSAPVKKTNVKKGLPGCEDSQQGCMPISQSEDFFEEQDECPN